MKVVEEHIGREVRERICSLMSDHQSDNGDIFVRLPTFYATGASVVVSIGRGAKRLTETESKFTVDDTGAGYIEAEALGVNRAFARHAREIAERIGISFHKHKLTVENVSRNQLPWAAIAVAGASAEAITLALQNVDEVEREKEADALVRRLSVVFPHASIEREVSIVGSSNTPWRVDAMIEWQGRFTAFEAVSPHHNSIYAAATKLGDIKALENAPGRVAVVREKRSLKTYEAILSRQCYIIEKNAPQVAYEHAVEEGGASISNNTH